MRTKISRFEMEQQKSDSLLYRLLPMKVAKSLRNGERVKPEKFDNVTIMFSDIVGFTTIASYSEPIETISILNNLFTIFDNIVKRYDVFKVETIGDAYLAVSGLPKRNNNHAEQIGLVALEFIDWCLRFKIEHMPSIPLQVRIGIHTGAVVSGVIGVISPQNYFCFFTFFLILIIIRKPGNILFFNIRSNGNFVDQRGSPNSIHISHTTKNWLEKYQNFIIEHRGSISLQGRGEFDTFWLLGRTEIDQPLLALPANISKG
ncbi:guanylate cyclase-like protein 4 [Sarcoptes scabiei]|uniref:Guanylate cyclase-like protein 4 n=1 Tax=Sarcoptes scabiei TaxID=52283 RepID=A0A132A3H2_SARSC|nr:guanylate cyclase-like protein 4 [Sarcoptes scabiei]